MDFITGVWNALRDTVDAVADIFRAVPAIVIHMGQQLEAVSVPLIILGALLVGWGLSFTAGWRRS